MRTLCFFLVLFIGGLMIQDFAYSQISVVIVEPCPDDELMGSIGLVTTLLTTGVTLNAETRTSAMVRGLSFMIAGGFAFILHEPEDYECFNLIDAVSVGSLLGGAFGVGIVGLGCLTGSQTPTSPNSVPTWQTRNYPIQRWNIGRYRRGLRFTYLF